MLSRKISAAAPGMVMGSGGGAAAGAGGSAAAGGIDRGRVGERLQASLAGLHELRLLREKQGDMVRWALQQRLDREEPTTSNPSTTISSSASTTAQTTTTITTMRGSMLANEEQRLEATLTALKQQLSRLRRQDVGLKTHLQQLDQQISELKIDVNNVSADQLESDSRPSSGFYELSDGGSCSLSNSCTSVYSECLSSSQTSLLQSPGSAPTSHNNNTIATAAATTAAGPNVVPVNADVCHRRRPADENNHTAAPQQPPTLQRMTSGLHLGSSRIRTGIVGLERPRPRPVSTGDLDRMLTAGPGCYKSPPVKTPPAMGPAPRTSTLDAKFQSSLMSRNGAEVYHYPSPLHAVALQSPIFSLAGEPSVTAEGQGPSADARPCPDDLLALHKGQETRCLGYIGTLLRRNSTARTSRVLQAEEKRDTQWTSSEDRRRELSESATARCTAEPRVVPPQPPAPEALDLASLEAKWERECRPDPVTPTPPTGDPAWRCQDPESLQRYSYPAAIRECSVAEDNTTAAVNHQDKLPAEHAAQARSHREKRHPSDARRETRVAQKKYPTAQKPVLSHSSSSTEETRPGWEGQGVNDFVHAKFVPAGSQHVKVRQADRKTKAVKLRKKAGEKPRTARHQQHQQQHAGYSSGERARETQVTTGCRGEVAARSGRAKASPRLGEQRKHSGSDSSLCAPGFMHSHRVHPKPGVTSVPVVTKAGKGRRPQRPEAEQPPEEQNRRRRQGTGRWPPVDAEAFQAACAPRTREDRYAHLAAAAAAAAGRQVVPHAAVPIARPHSGQWGASHRSSVYRPFSSGFFSALDARYPPAPYPGGTATRHPTRCESEYSAECASLFHSTIAASSVGDLSDGTTNRFGDSESSQSFSDSDSSLSLEEEEEGEKEECYRRVEGGAGALVWAQSAQGPTAAAAAAPGVALRRPPHPEAPACRIKASRALKKKIRRFQPATLKVMTLV